MTLRALYHRYDDLCGRYPRRMGVATFAAMALVYAVVYPLLEYLS